jgi:hypothetical protein
VACEKGAKTVPLKEGLQRGARVERPARACFARRLKRTISVSNLQKAGFSRLRRWAKSELRLWPLYSSPLCGLWTEKLICVF